MCLVLAVRVLVTVLGPARTGSARQPWLLVSSLADTAGPGRRIFPILWTREGLRVVFFHARPRPLALCDGKLCCRGICIAAVVSLMEKCFFLRWNRVRDGVTGNFPQRRGKRKKICHTRAAERLGSRNRLHQFPSRGDPAIEPINSNIPGSPILSSWNQLISMQDGTIPASTPSLPPLHPLPLSFPYSEGQRSMWLSLALSPYLTSLLVSPRPFPSPVDTATE